MKPSQFAARVAAALFLTLGMGIPVSTHAEPAPTQDLPAHTGPFVHPGVHYNADDLGFMRQKLAAKTEPWYSAWEKAKPRDRDDKWVPHPMADWPLMTNEDYALTNDGKIAHVEALQWALTGNPANAAKAIEMLNAWSSTLKTIIVHKMPQEKLSIGRWIPDFVNAAELLCYASPDGRKSGWSEADILRFKNMLRIFYGDIADFCPVNNGNWDALMIHSMICMSVFLDDQDMFNRAVTHYLKGVKPNGGLTNYIFPSGQCQESGRDMAHVSWGLGAFAATCEVAWKQGVDLYGADNNRLMVGYEYLAKYQLGNDVPFEWQGKPWDAHKISEGGRNSFAPIFETPYQHYVYRKGLEMPYTKQVIFSTNVIVQGGKVTRPYRPEGQYCEGIGWGTFTRFRGDEDPQALKKSNPGGSASPIPKDNPK